MDTYIEKKIKERVDRNTKAFFKEFTRGFTEGIRKHITKLQNEIVELKMKQKKMEEELKMAKHPKRKREFDSEFDPEFDLFHFDEDEVFDEVIDVHVSKRRKYTPFEVRLKTLLQCDDIQWLNKKSFRVPISYTAVIFPNTDKEEYQLKRCFTTKGFKITKVKEESVWMFSHPTWTKQILQAKCI